jgi:hypothetical protein
MKTRLLVMAVLPMAWALSSCGLVRAPFKVAGAVVEGTAKVGKKAYDKSADAFTKSDEEKAEEAKEKAEKEAKRELEEKKKEAEAAKREGAMTPPDTTQDQIPNDDYLPPLPDDAPVPYQGQ